MKKKTAVIAIILASLLVFGGAIFAILYVNGLTFIHNHTDPKEGQIRIACVGDSITYGFGIADFEHNSYPAKLSEMLGDSFHVANFGHSGATVSKDGDSPYTECKQFELSLEYKPDIVILMLGSNDSKAKNYTDLVVFMNEYEEIIRAYEEVNPDVTVFLCTPARAFFPDGKSEGETYYGIQPERVTSIATSIRLYARMEGYRVIDIYNLTLHHPEWFEIDKVHPSNEGALAIAEEIFEALGLK